MELGGSRLFTGLQPAEAETLPSEIPLVFTARCTTESHNGTTEGRNGNGMVETRHYTNFATLGYLPYPIILLLALVDDGLEKLSFIGVHF